MLVFIIVGLQKKLLVFDAQEATTHQHSHDCTNPCLLINH